MKLSLMPPSVFILTALFLAMGANLTSQTLPDGQRKEIRAVKVTGQSPKVDGKLDDAIWREAQFSSDFLLKEPVEGGTPSEKTEVAIVYDDDALYIAARLHSTKPDKLRMYLDRHDRQGPAEQFIVTIDSYCNRRTAYGFGVNCAGVRFDRYNPDNNEFNRDFSYNPVWNAETARDASSWSVEMEIPFSQLRFTDQPTQVWGINFNRWIPESNEDIYWIYVPRNETGWVSRFGNLVGVEGIKPSRRLELMPYAASDASMVDGDFDGNPFRDGREIDGRLGGDLKMGLGSNLTLDATVNPDFGQVELDPAEVNLSAFESFFDERRPFFIEGSQLLQGNGPAYFYSRRIGSRPHLSGRGDFVDQPISTSILGAAKITGQLKSGLSLGVLTAVTQKEHARIHNSDPDTTFNSQVEPATLYSVTRLQQQFGKDQSTIGILLTGVARDNNNGEISRIDNVLRRQAFSGGADWTLRFQGGKYELYGFAGFSHIAGSRDAILRTQLSSARYFQRPDADYLWKGSDSTFETGRTKMTGYTGYLGISKYGGKHWLWDLSLGTETPDFELNDMGALNSSDDIDLFARLVYRETNPGKIFRNYEFRLAGDANWNYGGKRQFSEGRLVFTQTWSNYWSSYLYLKRQFPGQDDRRTRGGPSMRNEAGYSFDFAVNNNFAAKTQYGVNISSGIDEIDGWIYYLSSNFSTRVGNHWRFAVSPYFVREDQPRQYVTTIDSAGGGAGTYGKRYIFSRIDRTTTAFQFRMDYFFSPDLSLEVYAEPFAASGKYYDHGELIKAGGHDLKFYQGTPGVSFSQSEDGDYEVDDAGAKFSLPYLDFGSRSFRSNIVLRWQFNPGSTLYLVWQRNLSEEREIGRHLRLGSIFDSLGADGEDFVALKIAYWIPVS